MWVVLDVSGLSSLVEVLEMKKLILTLSLLSLGSSLFGADDSAGAKDQKGTECKIDNEGEFGLDVNEGFWSSFGLMKTIKEVKGRFDDDSNSLDLSGYSQKSLEGLISLWEQYQKSSLIKGLVGMDVDSFLEAFKLADYLVLEDTSFLNYLLKILLLPDVILNAIEDETILCIIESQNLKYLPMIKNQFLNLNSKTVELAGAELTGTELTSAEFARANLAAQVSLANLSPDGSKIAVTSAVDTAKIWSVKTGECLHTLVGHEAKVTSVKFSLNGSKIVTASNDGTAKVWNAETGVCLGTLAGHGSLVLSADFSTDGSKVVTASLDTTAKVWDAETCELLHTLMLEVNCVVSASFSPDGSKVLTASRDNKAKVWDIETGECLYVLIGHENDVVSAKFNTDGSKIVTASCDQTARVWNAETGQCSQVLTGHRGWVNSAEFSPDGSKVITTSNDKRARVWSIKTDEYLCTLIGHEGKFVSAEFSSDGSKIVTVSYDGKSRVWGYDVHELSPKEVLAMICLIKNKNKISDSKKMEISKFLKEQEIDVLYKNNMLPPLTGAGIKAEISRMRAELEAAEAKMKLELEAEAKIKARTWWCNAATVATVAVIVGYIANCIEL